MAFPKQLRTGRFWREYGNNRRSCLVRQSPPPHRHPPTLRARARPSLVETHFDPSPLELNTQFSIERTSQQEIDIGYVRSPFRPQIRDFSTAARIQKEKSKERLTNMSTQQEHPALMIPGPIEFDDAVLQAMSFYRSDIGQFRSN